MAWRNDTSIMATEKPDIVIVGGGPAGLRVAELVSAAGRRTVLADAMPSVGRKLLVAGRGGLNLTHSEPVENFPARYGDVPERWRDLLADFSPHDLRTWAHDLGVETFVGTSGRVFPVTKQAAPLLRRWIARLRRQGVSFRARHRLAGLARGQDSDWRVTFTTTAGSVQIAARAVVLALGGASWPKTGSDGAWVDWLQHMGVPVTPLQPANCGYEVAWNAEFLREAEGLPLKNLTVSAGEQTVSGELLITRYGLEGGALYQLARTLRSMSSPQIVLDLKPTFSADKLAARIVQAKASLLAHATEAWRLSPAAIALLRRDGDSASAAELAHRAKHLAIALSGPRPIAEAISTAGGVAWSALDDHLMLQSSPGLFCAGEMIDWEAPTGGYLLQGCLATATRAAAGALRFTAR